MPMRSARTTRRPNHRIKHRIKHRLKRSKAASQNRPLPPTAVLPSLLRAVLIALGAGIVLLCAVCAVLLTTDDPGSYAALAAALIPCPAAVLCGVLSARSSPLGGLLSGLLGGALFCLCLFCLGLLLPQGTGSIGVQTQMLLSPSVRAGICTVLSAVGGYAASHRR